MSEQHNNDGQHPPRRPAAKGTARGGRFDGRTSEQRRTSRTKPTGGGQKRGGGGATEHNRKGHERNRRSLSRRSFSKDFTDGQKAYVLSKFYTEVKYNYIFYNNLTFD